MLNLRTLAKVNAITLDVVAELLNCSLDLLLDAARAGKLYVAGGDRMLDHFAAHGRPGDVTVTRENLRFYLAQHGKRSWRRSIAWEWSGMPWTPAVLTIPLDAPWPEQTRSTKATASSRTTTTSTAPASARSTKPASRSAGGAYFEFAADDADPFERFRLSHPAYYARATARK